jgi:hypothetical protein
MEEIGDISLRENDLITQLTEIFSHCKIAGQTEPDNLERCLRWTPLLGQ